MYFKAKVKRMSSEVSAANDANVLPNITLTVIVPAYNEEENLRLAIDGIIAGLPSSVTDYEVIVVDDGSIDNTPVILREITKENDKIKGIFFAENKGKGAALSSGFRMAQMEWILFTDADLQICMEELPSFIEHTREYDMVIGYRKVRGDSVFRQILSKCYSLLILILLGVRPKDVNCPFKLIKRTVIDSIQLMSRGFFIDTELVCLALSRKCRVMELGVNGYRRRHGVSSVRIRNSFETIRELAVFVCRGYKRYKGESGS